MRCAGLHQRRLTEDDVDLDGSDSEELARTVVADGAED